MPRDLSHPLSPGGRLEFRDDIVSSTEGPAVVNMASWGLINSFQIISYGTLRDYKDASVSIKPGFKFHFYLCVCVDMLTYFKYCNKINMHT